MKTLQEQRTEAVIKMQERISQLEKENAKAKQFIRDFLSVAIDYIDKEDKNYSLITEAEQFLNSEVEK